MMNISTKRQAIAEVRALANMLIEQGERRAKGFDKGPHRDDEVWPTPFNRIDFISNRRSREAMALSRWIVSMEAQ